MSLVVYNEHGSGSLNGNNLLTINSALVLIDANVKQETYEREDGSRGSNISFFQQRIDLLNNPKAEEVE